MDYEKSTIHQFLVRAKDAGGHPQHAQASITIKVNDENDCEPSILFDTIERNFAEMTEGRLLNFFQIF